ncbi:dipeptide/oligopeptide ABC transporter substrate-binding protein (plasmid) [Rhizobium etli 8C-3]|uniref:Peptide/nickel transport system substrate-binding protein n=2 Tax=Rhizobium TaxID=379 RepID=A0A4R3RHL0_9HYPH|nr:ABC transporter substrate-binding protein [Rhizobium azibense]APO78853.1 dipeptide/oligopeptide ABC transporter substrate-binding protein [Rhizobium etli 8C-3]TCU28826.1 peptide/nickel transport system substrate-binding protein [Rhizobium azibense]TCU33917.1 peptide/nickel transport system substrate-binding protein [Rhizobium azibense]
MNKHSAAMASVSLIGLMLAAAPLQAKTLNIALNADIRSLDPGVNRDSNSDAVVLHMVEGLVAYGEDASVKPLLAEKVAVSKDELTYTFTLRDGVKFHNGKELTSVDVLWSWNRYMAEATKWRCRPDFAEGGASHVVAADAPDKKTVVFKLEQPNALFLATLARLDCGMTGILEKSSLNDDGSFKQPVGTGPFKYKEWKKGEFVDLEAFPEYSARAGEGRDGLTGSKRPLVETVHFPIIPDRSSAKAALLSGDVDVVPDVPYADIAEFKQNADLDVSLASNPGITAVLFQTRDPLLKDVRIRKAISMAIDTNALVDGITLGLGKANNSLVPATSKFHSAEQAKGYKFDPEAAKTLLQEAGYDGRPIKLIANTRYANTYDAAVMAQAMLQQAGINVEIEVLEWAAQLDRYQSGNYTAMTFPYSARFDPALTYDSVMGNKEKEPRKVWDDPEAQALLAENVRSSDPAKRQELFDKLHARFLASVPFLMLYNGLEASAFQKSVQNYQASIFSMPRAWEVSIAD